MFLKVCASLRVPLSTSSVLDMHFFCLFLLFFHPFSSVVVPNQWIGGCALMVFLVVCGDGDGGMQGDIRVVNHVLS